MWGCASCKVYLLFPFPTIFMLPGFYWSPYSFFHHQGLLLLKSVDSGRLFFVWPFVGVGLCWMVLDWLVQMAKNTALEVTDSSVIKQSNSTSWQGSILGELIGARNKGSVILYVIWSMYVCQCVPVCFWQFLTLTCRSSRINGCQQSVSVIILGLLAWMTTRLRHHRRVLHLPRPRRNRLKIMFLMKKSQLRVRRKKESPARARWEGSGGPHHTLLDEGARFSGFTMFHLQEVTFHSS